MSPPKSKAQAENDSDCLGEIFPDASTATICKIEDDKKPLSETSRRIGNYEIIRIIGTGGIGAVYEAVHLILKKSFALKVLKAGNEFQPQLVERFKREMQAVGQIDHPNVIRATDAGEDEGVLFLAMDLICGYNLEVVIRRVGAMSTPNACAIIYQAALGLEAIRQKNMVHRDLKPSNMILGRDGVVKILDLGLARIRNGTKELTPTDCVMGTMDFQAPEQAQWAKDVDIRADIYSLGCSMYKLLTGSVPYKDALTPVQKIQAHAAVPFPALPSAVPATIAGTLERMVAKDRDERFATPKQLADALEPHLAGSDLKKLFLEADALAGRLDEDVPGMTTSLRRPEQSVCTTPRLPVETLGCNVAQPGSRKRRAILLGSLAVLVAIGLATMYGTQLFKAPRTADSATPFSTWIVSKSSTDANAFATLRQALARAKPGDRIAVVEDEIDERLDILEATCSRDVTIEGQAPSGRPVVWKPAANDNSEKPLLNIERVDGLCLKGFILHGNNQVNDLIRLEGDCLGARLENLQFQGFKRAAVRLHGCGGTQEHPIRLVDLTVRGRDSSGAAIAFSGPICRHVEVAECSFVGPMSNAAKLAASLHKVRFTHNRFANMADAFLIECDAVDPRHPFLMQIDSNTFHNLHAGVRLIGSELFEKTSKLQVSNNLFSRTDTLVVKAEELPPIGRDARWIAPDIGVAAGPYYFLQAHPGMLIDPAQVSCELYCDDQFKVWCNNALIYESQPDRRYHRIELTGLMRQKKGNQIAIRCENDSGRTGLLWQFTFVVDGQPYIMFESTESIHSAIVTAPDWQKYTGILRKSKAAWVARLQVTETVGNIRDKFSKEGRFSLQSNAADVQFLSVDPKTSENYLRYAKASPLAKAGFQAQPVGLPPSANQD